MDQTRGRKVSSSSGQIFFSQTGLTGFRLCDDDVVEPRANLRTEFEGELPCAGANMEGSPKRKSLPLTAGETKTSVMRQELNSGKGGKSKWSWKEREDDMRELERKNLEQKREIQKLKKTNDTTKDELDTTKRELEVAKGELGGIKEKLGAEQKSGIEDVLALGQYLDTHGKKYIILEDDIARKREEELYSLKEQIEKLENDNGFIRDTLSSTEEQRNVLSEKLVKLIDDKEKVDSSIRNLLKEKEQIELERETDSQRLKSEFQTVLKDIECKLQEKEKESYAIESEKNQLFDELNIFVEAKKQLEFEIDNMNGLIQEQVEKIDDLSVKILGRDEDLRSKLEEVEKAREECKNLQENNTSVGSEQEIVISNMWTKLTEITKILQEVEYCKKLPTNNIDPDESLDSSQEIDRQAAELIDRQSNNEDALNEELNSSIDQLNDSMDPMSVRSNTEIVSKFEEVRNLLLQKIAHIDNVITNRDYQINKCVYQTSEWKSNCEKLEEDAKALKETFEGLLDIKEKENHDLREQTDSLRNECSGKISELEKWQQERLAGMESSDAYYRDQVEFITSDFEKKSKEHESVLLEKTQLVEGLKQESNLLKNEIESKERELSEMSKKYELSISQVEEREKLLREDNERYLSEEIDRIQHDCKNKLKHLESEREANEVKLSQEYEDKVTEIEVAYEKLKTNNVEMLQKSHDSDDVSTQCEYIVEDKGSMTMENLSFQKEEVEEELRKIRDTLTLKVREYELLQAKYDAQHRLVDFVTLSLEQERAKKNNSNDEILSILEKLESKVSETLQCPNDSTNELYASESSINSMMTESLPESLYTNPIELNTTWPPKFNKRETSPIRRWSSLGILQQDQEKRKELIERLRTEISIQLNGMAPISTYPSKNGFGNGHKSSHINLPKPWSSIMDENDVRDHLSPLDRSNGMLSVKSYGKGVSPPTVRTLLKNEVSHDSGLDQNDDIHELISYPNQLHNVIEMFKRLDEQHEQLKEENTGSIDRQWSVDLENWKNRVQYKINDLKPDKAPSERSDSALSTISSSSILFHPNDNEVKAIIENANKMYDHAHFVL